jgi:hypothetical protein
VTHPFEERRLLPVKKEKPIETRPDNRPGDETHSANKPSIVTIPITKK